MSPESVQKDDLSLKLDDLVKIGRIEDVVEPIKGFRFAMHTLNNGETLEAMKSIKFLKTENESEEDTVLKFQMLQKNILILAIDKINDKILTKEEKIALLTNVQTNVFNMIYEEYTKLVDKQTAVIEELKKK